MKGLRTRTATLDAAANKRAWILLAALSLLSILSLALLLNGELLLRNP